MIKKILVAVLVLFTMMSNAQEGTSSPYSFYGIGIQKFKGTVENRTMGGLSVFTDSIHLNLQNPAALGELKLTNYTVGTTYSNFKLTSQTDSDSGDSASLDYLAIGIPAGRLGFAFGVIPKTSVGFNLESDQNGVQEQFTGSGGLNKVFLSTGVNILKGLNAGVELNYNFGNIRNKSLLSRENVQFDTREISSSNLSSFSVSLGLAYKTMISENLALSGSVVATPSFSLTSKSSIELATVLRGNNGQEAVIEEQEIEIGEGTIELPASLKVGAGIGKPKKWFLGGEYTYSDSGDFTEALFLRDGVAYTSSSKAGFGGFYIPKYNSLTSYFSRVVYRAGVRYEQTGLTINDQSIDEFGISFGIGLPVGRLFSNTNIGFEFVQRGTKDVGLVREDFFNFTIGLSLNDKWFRKIKFN